ncbi:hypothetical protein D9613_002974 [Agrocybe pediades]|uniref:Uncharacterized protein n=1 Tax=Agrocybe pediades TaxID=84607 RepID=A0A8H4QPI2_9AGAR|nr:hypothetical protein D9613_002974 [Agrocybe pediades]KAF9567539.1 hypothetical protein CPC08DRAFT_703076 [Agrocybe pediades]
MFVPFFSKRSDEKLYRRKGGGGKGGGSSGGGRSGGGTTGGRGGTGGGSARSSSVNTPIGSKSATSFGNGGGSPVTIPSGQLFAGRQAGGGTRGEVYGSRTYGSGYPGLPAANRGVGGLNFPFVFWPIAWGGAAGLGAGAYLHNREYGRPDNTSRPGGVMMTAAFISNTQNNTFRLVADNETVTSLIQDIQADCSSNLKDPDSITATNYFDNSTVPQPEQTVQYYRASSVALTLDGYNNTGALQDDNTPDTPLPSNLDNDLLTCLNTTIGEAVPLVDSASFRLSAPSNVGLVGLIYLLWTMSSMF